MNNFDELIGGGDLVLVDFFATWCGPCKMMAPILTDVKKLVGDKVRIVKIDIDKSEDLARRYTVQSVPTLMLFKDGKLLWREAGVHQTNDIVSLLERHYK